MTTDLRRLLVVAGCWAAGLVAVPVGVGLAVPHAAKVGLSPTTVGGGVSSSAGWHCSSRRSAGCSAGRSGAGH